jgi:hypothetical protein
MRQVNFTSTKGFEIPNQGQFSGISYDIYDHSVEQEKPYLISAATADKITKAVGIIALFAALFLIGLNS